MGVWLSLALAVTTQVPGPTKSAGPVDPGTRNIHVTSNYGLIVQNNVAPPSVRKQIMRRHLRKDWENVLLPGTKAAPPAARACDSHPMPVGAFRVILGSYGDYYCTGDVCPIIQTENRQRDYLHMQNEPDYETLLSISHEGSAMRVHGVLFASDGKIEAAIEDDNKIRRNPNDTFEWRHPNAQTLDVIDDSYKESLHIEFLNPTTLYVEGTFYNRVGDWVRLNAPNRANDPINSYGMKVRNMCSLNTGGYLF